jgi:VanZ family protein
MRIYKFLTGIFILILISIVAIANLGLGPIYFPFIYELPGMDKVGHFILAGLLSYLVNRLFKGQLLDVLSIKVLKGSLIIILIVALEELSQLFLLYRAFSWLDLAFDLGGITLGGWLAVQAIKREQDREQI